MRVISRFFGHPLVRFIITGGLNTAITYGIYLGLKEIVQYQAAYFIAYVLGVLFSYGMNALFVFRRRMSLKTFVRFPLVYIVQYVASAVLLEILVRWAAMSTTVAPIIAIVVTVPLTFLISRAIFTRRWSLK